MRIQKIDISEIDFMKKDYSEELFQSVLRIGFSFPISVKQIGHHYICVDGHKRLSVLEDILTIKPDYHRGRLVPVIIKNNGDARSNDCWRGKNSH